MERITEFCDSCTIEYPIEQLAKRTDDVGYWCTSCSDSTTEETKVSGAKALRTPPTSNDVGIRAGDIL